MNRNSFYYLKIGFIWIAYLPVVFVTYIIVWLDRKIRFPLSFPRDIDELAKQKEWCVSQLKKNNVLPENAVINNYTVTPLNQDLIFRSNAGVIEINYSLAEKNEPLKCFAKFAPTMGSVGNRTIFNLQLNHIKETWFNRHFVKEDKTVAAPEVYFTDMSVFTGNLCLITEMMSGCEEYTEGKGGNISFEHLELALENLAALHAHYWKDNSVRMKKVLPIEDNTVYLFDSMVVSSWSVPARNILVQSWKTMNIRETVLHGDARIGNMLFPKEKDARFVFIDWQAVRQGKAVYDLAYFLVLSLSIEFRKANEQKCIDTYYQYLIHKGVKDYTKKELEEDYRHACLCVLVLLSLPMLSGEASVEGNGAKIFAWGMNIWRERMQAKFNEFDYEWLAKNYNMTEAQAREAVVEMLNVIHMRLEKIERKLSS